ncbi:MAG TPA: crossover junction endodeoxyribonuclease RuvC, partial [Candidatus Eisenbacteria bacterium]|nr:crossover junction endodeoxyribonuclease RuvC [Candidatus Eisenbacteria bacterium]
MKILGIDPGSQVLGYGLLEALPGGPQSCDSGTLRTSSTLDLCERLLLIHREIERLLGAHRPDIVAVETAFYHKNVRSTLILGHVRGVVLLAARQAGLDVAEYAPREVKMAVTGHGDAAKEQVAFMVRRLLSLSETPPSDAADALAV